MNSSVNKEKHLFIDLSRNGGVLLSLPLFLSESPNSQTNQVENWQFSASKAQFHLPLASYCLLFFTGKCPANFQINDKTYLGEQILFLKKKQLYSISCNQISEINLFVFDTKLIEKILDFEYQKLLEQNQLDFSSFHIPKILHSETLRSFQTKPDEYLLLTIFLNLMDYYSQQLSTINSAVDKSLSQYDLQNLYKISQKLTAVNTHDCNLQQIANEVGMSTTKFKISFKKVFGKSPYSYFLYHKMAYAKKLIIENKKTILEVSEELGYSNSSNFSKIFKKITSQLPSKLISQSLPAG